MTAQHDVREIVFIGDPLSADDLRLIRNRNWFHKRALKEYGMTIVDCETECAERFPGAAPESHASPSIERIADTVVVRFGVTQ